MRSAPRFPGVAADAGHYESYYLKLTRPGGGRGAWIRHTVHKRPEAQATAALWFTLFDAEAHGPRAVKATFGAGELAAPDGGYIRVDGALLEPGRASGAIASPELEASWDLRFSDEGRPFHHLPHERLYEAPLPRTKFLSPYPSARFDGRLTVGGEEIMVDSWPGMIGHNWGAEHADRWIWVQGAFLDGPEPAYFDLAAGRIRVGRFRTPWVANGMLRLGGAEHRLGGFGKVLSTTVSEAPTACRFRLAGKGIGVRGRVFSAAENFVAWVYADPKGPEHNTLNCSIADLELEVARDGRPVEHLRLIGAAAYELGTRETDHGIPLQPYPDG